MSLNEKQIAILRAISDGQTSQEQIVAALNWDKDLVVYYLDELSNTKSALITSSSKIPKTQGQYGF